MPTYAEKRFLPFSVMQIFNLVADVEKYPEFLPAVISANILSKETAEAPRFIVDLEIGYKFIKTGYRSEVILNKPNKIDIRYISGPFLYLNNCWNFKEAGETVTEVDFFIDFEFKSNYFQIVLQSAFNEVVKRMIQAFEKRAIDIYK